MCHQKQTKWHLKVCNVLALNTHRRQNVPMSIHDESYHEMLYRNIGEALGRADWSNTRAAEAIGMKRSTFSAKRSGTSDFRIRELVRLAQSLNIPFSELTKGFDDATELSATSGNQEVAV